jgi:hypothetical protein
MPNFSSKFKFDRGLQKPPAVCKKKPPQPPSFPIGCPPDLGSRTTWWLQWRAETPLWPDYFPVVVDALRFSPGRYGGVVAKAWDQDGPPRILTTVVAWTYDELACDWQLAIDLADDHYAFTAGLTLHLPLLDTLPLIIEWQSPLIGSYTGTVEFLGLVNPLVI